MKNINLPNRLSLLRICMIVPFVILAARPGFCWQIGALALFAAACVTDALDGNIARKRNMVTNFGKFIDPIADKLLVMSALVLFVAQGRMPAWVCILMLGREFAISGFRLVAAGSGNVIAAGMLGKIKTVTQMVAVILILLFKPVAGDAMLGSFGVILSDIAMYIACFMTVLSGVDYIARNFSCISDM